MVQHLLRNKTGIQFSESWVSSEYELVRLHSENLFLNFEAITQMLFDKYKYGDNMMISILHHLVQNYLSSLQLTDNTAARVLSLYLTIPVLIYLMILTLNSVFDLCWIAELLVK